MLRIGEFSRLARVSVKALHLYDRIGLLGPAHTDGLSGYRYYTGDQLPRLNAILALKELGFTLDQIRELLDEELSLSQIRALLELKREETRRALKVEGERLSRIEARLRQVEREGAIPGRYEIVLKPVEEKKVASVREVLPAPSGIGKLFGELGAHAASHGTSPVEWVSVWHDLEYREEEIDGEAAIVTRDPLPGDERVRERTLPAVADMASTVHHGPFETISGAYAALLGWISENGYRVAGPNRELYLRSGNERDNPDYVTEIQFPVEKPYEEEERR
ncbi:MAG: MerR family transcriptional regulator [Rubrobacteraceae bacterium]